MATCLSRFFKSRDGNIAVTAALSAPLLIAGLAISVDYSALLKQRRSEQATVDLAAIAAAADPGQARVLLQRYYADNGLNYAVQEGGSVYLPGGKTAPSVTSLDVAGAPDCIATVETGHFEADPALPVSERFQPGASVPDAVRVKQQCRGRLYFASAVMPEPDINVSATAASKKLASYWIGSRLGSLDGGLANAVFGALFGTTVSLKVGDYNALLSANVDVLSTVKALATNINMSAVTYNDLLDADVTLAQFFRAMRVGGNLSASAQASLRLLEISVSRSNRTFKLSQILNLASIGKQMVGTGYGGTSTADALGLIRAAGAVSNGRYQVELTFDYNVPGLGNVNFRLMIGEPPVGAQSVGINTPGSLVRTAQMRTLVTFTQGLLPSMAGVTLRVPIYIEAANSEARLSDIQCKAGKVTGVKVETFPGLAELIVGDVDETAFINFGNKPRVTPATLVAAPGVTVKGSAQVDVNNISGTLMDFNRTEIDASKVKNASVTTPITSYLTSIIKHLDLDVNVLGAGSSSCIAMPWSAPLSALTTMTLPADRVLATYMFIYGYKIGEADVSVTGGSCSAPSLVL
ncbi:TadG family pilus assembly protein [Rhizobium sp. C4]|uniref:TadG family pilus assembly protein n=1 Tax=Rhizobium sp. C4 TaxID=1349800 RepID=UPI001E3F451B|nr:pilus assembly protein TadG-related protein [Rhizobium sp. C4]MCD2171351.1 pilus assembly protein TadG-related protein [Rhizobium sp. C4]